MHSTRLFLDNVLKIERWMLRYQYPGPAPEAILTKV